VSIRAHRLIVGMSQSDLARKLGVSFQQIQKYEKGANRVAPAGFLRSPRYSVSRSTRCSMPMPTRRPGAHGYRSAKLIPDRNALKLLTAFGLITDRGIRHRLVDLVGTIAKRNAEAAQIANRSHAKKARNHRDERAGRTFVRMVRLARPIRRSASAASPAASLQIPVAPIGRHVEQRAAIRQRFVPRA